MNLGFGEFREQMINKLFVWRHFKINFTDKNGMETDNIFITNKFP